MPHQRPVLPSHPDALSGNNIFGRGALIAAVLSFLGFSVLVIGHLLDPAHFNNTKHSGAGNNVAFFAFVVGLLVALFLGSVTWFYGSRLKRRRNTEAVWATGYALTFTVVAVIAVALGG